MTGDVGPLYLLSLQKSGLPHKRKKQKNNIQIFRAGCPPAAISWCWHTRWLSQPHTHHTHSRYAASLWGGRRPVVCLWGVCVSAASESRRNFYTSLLRTHTALAGSNPSKQGSFALRLMCNLHIKRCRRCRRFPAPVWNISRRQSTIVTSTGKFFFLLSRKMQNNAF